MGLSLITLVHILISLAGIVVGLVVLGGWLAGRHSPRLTALFLVTTAATSVTGLFFPFHGFTPAYAVAGLSLCVLLLAAYALYVRRLSGRWNKIWVINAILALYLNVFVLVAQLFQKTPTLRELAPTQSEPPFVISQVLVVAAFVGFGVAAVRGFRAVSR